MAQCVPLVFSINSRTVQALPHQNALNFGDYRRRAEWNRRAFGCRQVLDSAFGRSEFAFAGDHGDEEFFSVGILELFAELGWLGIDLDFETRGSKLCG